MRDYNIPVYQTRLIRVADFPTKRPQISTSEETANFILPYIKNKPQEEVVAIFLDIKNYVIGIQTIHIGCPWDSDVFLPSILTPTLLSGATKLVVVHNHPMGDATDTINEADEDMTFRLLMACQNIGIVLCDHVIVDDSGRFRSVLAYIRQEGQSHNFPLDAGHVS